jgi:hypothetical protein
VTSGGIRCSKGTLIMKKKPNPSLLSKEEQRKKEEKQKSCHWTNIWPWVPAGLDAKSDRAGWLPAVSHCSALLSGEFAGGDRHGKFSAGARQSVLGSS